MQGCPLSLCPFRNTDLHFSPLPSQRSRALGQRQRSLPSAGMVSLLFQIRSCVCFFCHGYHFTFTCTELDLHLITQAHLRSLCNSCELMSSPPCLICHHQQTLQNPLLSPFSGAFMSTAKRRARWSGSSDLSALQEAICSFQNRASEETLTAGCWQEQRTWFLVLQRVSPVPACISTCPALHNNKVSPAQDTPGQLIAKKHQAG